VSDRGQRIEEILIRRFSPVHLALHDESHKHVGHRGATSGGGHYQVTLVAAEFEGLSLLERHRRVNEALKDLFGATIHALSLKTLAPTEWKATS